MNTTQTQQIEVGTKVAGTYMGSEFTGTVSRRRAHTINHKVTEVTVDLDSPIYIALIKRTETQSVQVATSFDGSALNGEAGNWGDPTDYVKAV